MTTETTTSAKRPIRSVLFIDTNGSVLSWSAAEIKADPEGFRSYSASERERGVTPLAMR